MATKVQRKFYIAKTLADALRIEAARKNESQSSIVERALRRELGMTVQEAADTITRLRVRLDELEFAETLGFDSYESLMQASESIVSEGDVDWFITHLPDGRWAAWDDAELVLDRVAYFQTREAAVQYHLDAARSAGIVEE